MDTNMVGEEINENEYEPSEEELIEYAQYLGIDPIQDKLYLYIAKEGLNAPLPREWKACKNDQDEIFYKNIKSNETTWSHPLDDFFRQKFQDAKKKNKETELIERQKPKPGKQLPKIMINASQLKKTQNRDMFLNNKQSLETKNKIQDNLNKNLMTNLEIDKKCSNIQQEQIKNIENTKKTNHLFDQKTSLSIHMDQKSTLTITSNNDQKKEENNFSKKKFVVQKCDLNN